MTILAMTGMDLFGVTANLVRFFETIPGANVAYSTTSGRYGGGGITVSDDDFFFGKAIPGSPQTCVVSFAVFRTGTSVQSDFIWHMDNNIFRGGISFKSVDSSSAIQVLRGGAVLGTFVLGTVAWHWVSIKVKLANTGGTVDVEVDGVGVFSFTGDTVSTGIEECVTFLWAGGRFENFIYDDFIITDVAGAAPFNDLIADRRIDTIQPNATGASADFTAEPVVDNYLNVDEASPDDDTTYVEAETSTDLDLYNMAAMGFSPSSIDVVNVVALVKNPDAGGTQLKLKVKTGTTEGTGAAQSPTSEYLYFAEQFLLDPDTAAAWTESGVNAMQAGYEIA